MPAAHCRQVEGEPAFRALERAVCHEMSGPRGFVIAAGGGAVIAAVHHAEVVAARVMSVVVMPVPHALHLADAPSNPEPGRQ